MYKVLKVGKVLTPTQELEKVVILIQDEKIKKIVNWNDIPQNWDVLSYPNAIAVPGFIDIHTHGYGGYDATSGSERDLIEMGKAVLKHGVTSFLPTAMTASKNTILNACIALRKAIKCYKKSAEIIGLHLEGPYLSKAKTGAQNKEFIKNPDIKEMKEFVRASGNNIRRITIAPELPGALELIRHVRKLGITVAIGHTNATYEEAIEGFNSGATICNHFYNGMRGFHHRDPGVIGACLEREDIYVEVITDMIHVHPAALKIAIKAKGLDKILFITDSISATGLPDGEYMLGGLKIVVKNGVSRVKATGSLAGSTLTMDVAIRNAITNLGLSLKDAVRMATLNPANALDLPDHGRLAPNCVANITVINPKIDILATIVKGELFYEAK